MIASEASRLVRRPAATASFSGILEFIGSSSSRMGNFGKIIRESRHLSTAGNVATAGNVTTAGPVPKPSLPPPPLRSEPSTSWRKYAAAAAGSMATIAAGAAVASFWSPTAQHQTDSMIEDGQNQAIIKEHVNRRFFNRFNEMESLRMKLNTKPEKVLLILGPQNSGKTRLKDQIIAMNEERVMHINCGMDVVTSPMHMAQLMQEAVVDSQKNTWRRLLKLPLNYSIEELEGSAPISEQGKYAKGIALAVRKMAKEHIFDEGKVKLGDIQKSYKVLMEMLPQFDPLFQQKRPIIIIDEVNKIRQWEDEHAKELGNFTDFLKRISKEANQAHVVLLTSDSSMMAWLAKEGIGPLVREVLVLGDLSEEEAERLMRGGPGKDIDGKEEIWPGLISQSPALTMNDTEWKKVYQACGGNIYLLSTCVETTMGVGWDEAIADILIEPDAAFNTTLIAPDTLYPPPGVGPALWTADHYKAVVRLIVESEYGAVNERIATAALKDIPLPEGVEASPSKVLLSMVEWNVLSMRSYFKLAKDVPRQAFGADEVPRQHLGSVVRMPSTPHFVAAKDWVDSTVEAERKSV